MYRWKETVFAAPAGTLLLRTARIERWRNLLPVIRIGE
jgi:hypothetical protein